MGANIGVSLFILNEGVTKAGYLKSEYLSPNVSNDSLTVEGAAPGLLSMPCEVYYSNDGQYTFLILRSGIVHGRMWPFGFAFTDFVKRCEFRDVSILTGTVSPVRRGRESNREIPEIYAYVNNHLHKKTKEENGDKTYYETYGIKKIGHWLGKDKTRAHQELEEMSFAGAAKGLMKAFNKHPIPTSLYVIFTPGGIDFVGGFTYYQFLKNSFKDGVPNQNLGKVTISEESGEEIHKKIFEEKVYKSPAHWKHII